MADVSILTGPFGPVQLATLDANGAVEVSILTGPFGPVQPRRELRQYIRSLRFQSSPALSGRCNGTYYKPRPGAGWEWRNREPPAKRPFRRCLACT